MSDANDLAEHVREALCEVIDPEIGFNIVDIGLVYDIAIEEGGIAKVTMTTTTKGCPATNYLRDGAGEAAQSVKGIHWADVRLTYDPPWTPDMMSPTAKRISRSWPVTKELADHGFDSSRTAPIVSPQEQIAPVARCAAKTADTGEADAACRIAGKACVILRQASPEDERRFNALLHRLVQRL